MSLRMCNLKYFCLSLFSFFFFCRCIVLNNWDIVCTQTVIILILLRKYIQNVRSGNKNDHDAHFRINVVCMAAVKVTILGMVCLCRISLLYNIIIYTKFTHLIGASEKCTITPAIRRSSEYFVK